ncbi:hypothetical protein SAMN02745218_01792 [Desulfofundulus australicus DSM 11792]|uniref:Methionine synthase II (Cobalamin-independent) n=1 Tax=Desulfofundulus australicus DSM 11792 TaxID=1121425 RepID=A0A1M5A469_9FIRM|nr:hypothetical protein [Desulfofundulus australicus]SHF25024.1 hypothetical protein SAMN02745218_01792 [Desulfofundulus australicus DSM 11792]
MTFSPGGLATGIGSLPFTDPGQALPLIKENMPEIPHWPQLPRRGKVEGFVYQFLQPLVHFNLLVMEEERAVFDDENPSWPERLADFYTAYLAVEEGDLAALEYFALPRQAAAGFYAFLEEMATDTGEALYLKGHLAGPLTIAFQLKNRRGRLAYYEEQLRDLVVKTLAAHACWQARALAALNRTPIIFVDEPAVSVYGQSSYITVTREMIKSDLNTIFQFIHRAGGLAGVHSCDAIDWSILCECDLDIINLDAYNFGSSLKIYARELRGFLENGGVIAWGIVPTSEKAFEEDDASLLELWQTLVRELAGRGIPLELLHRQSLITPACGTGLLEPELAGHIYRLTRRVSERVRRGVF